MNANQFGLEASVGSIDLQTSGIDHGIACRISPESAATEFFAGQGVILVDLGAKDHGGVPIVDVVSADTAEAFGAIAFSTKKGKFSKGDIVKVSQEGDVQRFTAKAAVLRGAKVALEKATPGNIQAIGANAQFGTVLDKGAIGDIVRVKIKTLAP